MQGWALALLLYPGLLFGIALALAGDWLLGVVRPLLARRLYRSHTRQRHFLQPLYGFLKLARRQASVAWERPASGVMTRPLCSALAIACVLAPVLALTLLPFPGNPTDGQTGSMADLILVLALLTVQPLVRAVLRLQGGGLVALRGAQDLGRLLTALLPVLAVVAALVEVSGSRSLQIAALSAAPETASQALVRLLAGLVLLAALPWLLDGNADRSRGEEMAATYAGRLLQAAALSALWSVLVLPALGEPVWAIAASLAGALFAFVTMRLIGERWAAARREKDAASLAWATALPVSALALIVALWLGA